MNSQINETFKKCILEVVSEELPHKKKPKYSNENYLSDFIYILTDLIRWESLRLLHPDRPQYYYKTAQDKFLQWSRCNIFEKAYFRLLKKYTISELKRSTTLNLFIDTADINNKYGSELVKYGKNKKKRVTKISYIADKNKTVYGITFFSGNTADINTLMPSVDDLVKRIKYRRINLTGDKGYISAEKAACLLDKYNVKLHTPARKNMKKKTGKITKKHLKGRYAIENTIQTNKSHNRICLRRDRLMTTYKSFVFLSLILKFSI
jgi:hypothetical protein